jgi:ABC-2 type transport system permease protein
LPPEKDELIIFSTADMLPEKANSLWCKQNKLTIIDYGILKQRFFNHMNRALWRKAFCDVWVQLLISSLVLVGFSWILVWLVSLFKADLAIALLKSLPEFLPRILGMPLSALVTPTGAISLIFVHVVTLLVCIGWAVGRGSDAICGEIGRGTMDLLVSLPVWRATLIVVPAVVATLGTAVLMASIMLGIALGIKTVRFSEEVFLVTFVPGAINLFLMIFCLAGITTLLSSIISDRWRTIALTVGFYVVELIIESTSRIWPAGSWLHYLTFLSVFQPQTLILLRGASPGTHIISDSVLLGIGLLCYTAGAVIFSLRDIPTSR